MLSTLCESGDEEATIGFFKSHAKVVCCQVHGSLLPQTQQIASARCLVLLPPPRHRLLRLAQKKLRHGRIALLQHAIATFGVDVVLKRNLRIARIELEGFFFSSTNRGL